MTTTRSAHRRRVWTAGHGGNRLSWVVSDIATMAKRNILAVMRTPEALFFTTLQPIMFTLLFTYVFGGAIHVPGGHTSSS